MEDQLYNHVCVYLCSKTYQTTDTSVRKKIRRYAAEMILKKDVLYKLVDDNCVLVIKREQVANILKECHDDIGGHKGIPGTYGVIKQRYFWHGMYQEVKNYVRSYHFIQILSVVYY